ncbi:MAG: PAS domain S-box protein [Candidatus Eremiobacterota bacterium]
MVISEENRTEILDNIIALQQLDVSGKILYVNRAFCKLHRQTSEELEGIFIWDLMVDCPERHNFPSYIEYLLKEHPEKAFCYTRNLRKDGTDYTVRIDWNYMKGIDSGIAGFIAVISDISDIKNIQVELKRSREDWENIFQAIGEPVLIIGREKRILSANRAVTEATGLPPGELIGMNCYNLFHSNSDGHPCGCPFDASNESGHHERSEMEVEALGGYFLISCTPVPNYDGNVEKVIHIATDITDRKNMEEALKNSERRYRTIFENIQDIYYETLLDGTIVEVSPSIEMMSKYKREELLGKSVYDIYVNPVDRKKLLSLLKSEGKVMDYEVLLKDRDNTPVPCSITTKIITDDRGNPLKICGNMRDIRKRKKAEEELDRSKEQVVSILESINDGFFALDDELKVTYFNRAACRLLGRKKEDVLGYNIFDAFPEVRGSVFEEKYNLAIKEKKALSFETFFDISPYKNWYSVRVYPYEEGISVYFQVVTEKKKSQKRLEKMNACFLNLGIDTEANIQSLTALLGELLEADITLYNRLDCDMICAAGKWNVPDCFNTYDRAEGHICYDLIKHNIDRPLIVRDLNKTDYLKSDPNVEKYGLKTYIGQLVKSSGMSRGSLCAVFKTDFSPSSEDLKLLSILSSAIGKEEERKIAEDLFIESEIKYFHLFEQLCDAAFLVDRETGCIVQANNQAEILLGMERKEIKGHHHTFLHPPIYVEKYREYFKKVFEGTYTEDLEGEIIRTDGAVVPVNIVTSGVTLGSSQFILGIFRHISCNNHDRFIHNEL